MIIYKMNKCSREQLRENVPNDTFAEESALRIEALRDRIIEISEGNYGDIAKDFMEGVVFSEEDLRLMPTNCFYNIYDILRAIEIEEENMKENKALIETNQSIEHDEVIPGQISIWDLSEDILVESESFLAAA